MISTIFNLAKIFTSPLIADRPNLKEARKVEEIQDIYVKALSDYSNNKYRKPSGNKLANLLSILTELRSLGFMNNEQCHSVRNEKYFPEFLAELWDVEGRNSEYS